MTTETETKPRKKRKNPNMRRPNVAPPIRPPAEEFCAESVAAWARLQKIYNLAEIARELGIERATLGHYLKKGMGLPEKYLDEFHAITAVPKEFIRPDVMARRKAEEQAERERQRQRERENPSID